MANFVGRNSAQRGWRGAECLAQIPNLGDWLGLPPKQPRPLVLPWPRAD